MIVRPNTIFWEQEKGVVSNLPAVMSNGLDIFTISGGPIMIVALISFCVTVNDATASTMQWRHQATGTTISGASASLALASVGYSVTLNQTSLATAPDISTNGIQLGANVANRITVPAGLLELVIGVGSTTGTWRHYMRYVPLTPDSFVVPAL